MPDPNIQVAPVSAPPQDAVIPATATPVAEPALSEREKIYEKYYQQQEAVAPPTQVAAPAPAAVEPPSTPAPQATPAPSPDVIAQLVAEVQSLRQRLDTPPPPPPAPVPPSNLTQAEQKDWLALMAEGKREEGERLFANKIEQEISERIQQNALERMEANRRMYEFTTKIRSENSDLASMEDYIAYAAKAKVDDAYKVGRIKTPADYATVYQEAVSAEVEKARNLVNTFRGVGKNEALTRSREVVSTQTLQPNAINQNRETPAAPSEPAQETVEDYFTQRRQRSLAGRGLTVA